jgi:PKD repeat protein
MKIKMYLMEWTKVLTAFSLLLLVALSACSSEDEVVPDKEVTAAFSTTAKGNTVTFINASANAKTYAWDFGDGKTSTEVNPVHVYDEPGEYAVTLKASNPTFEKSFTANVLTENAGPIARVLVGKTWIAIRGQALAYAMGPQSNDWSYKGAPWFGWGDLDGASQQLLQRQSLMNDEYTFNADGTYNVDFKGDFWGEFGIWAGSANDETDIILDGKKLPPNKDGVDVSAFVAGSWAWEVDEIGKTLAVKGAGAHILNPRYKNNQSSIVPGNGITYHVVKAVTGPVADTLVLYVELHDNNYNSDPRQYHVLASYHGTPPQPKSIAQPQYAESVSASTIYHSFVDAEGAGAGVASTDGNYDVDYSANIGGHNATKLTKDDTESDRFTNYLFFAGTRPSTRKEIDFSGGHTIVKLDVYFPSTNNFSGDFKNLVRIRFIDQSQFPGNFWEHYVQLEQSNIELDKWVTLTFDFTAAIAEAASRTPANKPDGVMIEFGDVNHIAGGTIYVKDFRIVAPQ